MGDQQSFRHPKIIAINDQEVADALVEAGFSVTKGSFGAVQNVGKLMWAAINEQANLPNIQEQEVVFVNLAPREVRDDVVLREILPNEIYFYQEGKRGSFDSRAIGQATFSNALHNSFVHGALFVVSISTPTFWRIKRDRANNPGLTEFPATTLKHPLSFLPPLECIRLEPFDGSEVKVSADIPHDTQSLMRQLTRDAVIESAFKIPERGGVTSIVLATNKFGTPIAALFKAKGAEGVVLLLPQCPQLPRLAARVLTEVLAPFNPHLFAEVEGKQWVNDPKIESDKIKGLRRELRELQEQNRKEEEAVQGEIARVAEELRWERELLTESDDRLVKAVIHALRTLGFKDVIDSDLEHKEGNKKEDIRIHDADPILIVDVKGIYGNPDDAECTQAVKHTLMRSREFGKVGQALTIINHQRNIPPWTRDSNPFRKEMIDNSVETGSGLLTTIELLNICRNTAKWNWPIECVTPIFYRLGFIKGVPEHYQLLGKVVRSWNRSFGVVPHIPVKPGQRVAIENDGAFLEMVIESIMINEDAAQLAEQGANCGIRCHGLNERLKLGTEVFLVES